MTLFAVACAGMFPLLHIGRPWFVYWLFPYPNTMGMWPHFRSPLIWDVFAVSTYATVSLLFWFVGLIPDLATLRDRATQHRRPIDLRRRSRWAGAARPGTGTATRRPTCCSPASRRRWSSRCTRVVSFDFAIVDRAGLARDDLPAVLRRRRHLRRLRDGADAGDPAARSSTASKTSSPMRHLDNMAQGDARDRPDRRLRLRDGGLHGLVQRRIRTRSS